MTKLDSVVVKARVGIGNFLRFVLRGDWPKVDPLDTEIDLVKRSGWEPADRRHPLIQIMILNDRAKIIYWAKTNDIKYKLSKDGLTIRMTAGDAIMLNLAGI